MHSDFDIAALSYDATFTNSTIGKAQRKQVQKHLKDLLCMKSKKQILELNCGTGEDASYFEKLGHEITATDISNEMLKIAKQKSKNSKSEFKILDIKKIKQIENDKTFDLIFSNFGGFNCLSKKEITTFFSSVKNILQQNGKLVLVIMPKNTIWEKIYFFFKGDFTKVKRRNTTNAIKANVDGVSVKTWYFNPNEIKNIAYGFSVIKIKPIGLFVPPSYLQNSFLGNKIVISVLQKLDHIFELSFLSKYADHYYIEFQKKSDL